MSKTNCINCGAMKEVGDPACPFCGTRYTDLRSINPYSQDPVYIEFPNHNGEIKTAKAYISMGSFSRMPVCMESTRGASGRLRRGREVVMGKIQLNLVLFEPLNQA